MLNKTSNTNLLTFKKRKLYVFVIFLLVSLGILILTKLSREYTYTIKFNIEKQSIPKQHIVLSDTANTLNITIKTNGFRFLKYFWSKKSIPINFQESTQLLDSTYKWTKTNGYEALQDYFSKHEELINVSPEELYFNFDTHAVKKVPIVLISETSFFSGYNSLNGFKLTPDSIEVIGPKNKLKTINNIETQLFKRENINQDVMVNLDLKTNNNLQEDIIFSNKTIVLTAKVEKFTEGMLQVPITVENVPENINITYFPKKVNITYYTSLKVFKTISENDFKISCNFKNQEKAYLVPELIDYPNLVKNVKIKEQQIQYIITQ